MNADRPEQREGGPPWRTPVYPYTPRREPRAWFPLSKAEDSALSERLMATFDPGDQLAPDAGPNLREPNPSITFSVRDVAQSPLGDRPWNAANVRILELFVEAMPGAHELLVLDQFHAGARLLPNVALTNTRPVYVFDGAQSPMAGGDHSFFLTPDFTEGTYGNPWEHSLCVFGPRLLAVMAPALGAIFPVLRVNGVPPGGPYRR